MERLAQFWPSFVAAVLVAFVVTIFMKFVQRWKILRETETDTRGKKQIRLICQMVGVLVFFVPGLICEEFIFRAPLILFFPELTYSAWFGVIVSTVLFSVYHMFWKKRTESYLSKIKIEESGRSALEELEELGIQKRQIIHYAMFTRFTSALILGMLAGGCAVQFQSFWLAIGIHFLWNLLMPMPLGLVCALCMRRFCKS